MRVWVLVIDSELGTQARVFKTQESALVALDKYVLKQDPELLRFVRHDRIEKYFLTSEDWYTLSEVEVED